MRKFVGIWGGICVALLLLCRLGLALDLSPFRLCHSNLVEWIPDISATYRPFEEEMKRLRPQSEGYLILPTAHWFPLDEMLLMFEELSAPQQIIYAETVYGGFGDLERMNPQAAMAHFYGQWLTKLINYWQPEEKVALERIGFRLNSAEEISGDPRAYRNHLDDSYMTGNLIVVGEGGTNMNEDLLLRRGDTGIWSGTKRKIAIPQVKPTPHYGLRRGEKRWAITYIFRRAY